MTNYETLYILKPDLEDEKKDALITKFSEIITNNGGEISKTDEWGKRRLAYPINYINDGYYVLTFFAAKTDLPAELERNFKISDDVIRYIVVNLDNQ
ncbi:MAG: 30S ribosomal protein S6 [Eubacteriales bacterium]